MSDDFDTLRVPPHSLEAEQAVLGGLLLDQSAFDQISGLVSAQAFYRHEHRTIFAAIAALCAAGKTVDIITVNEAVQAEKGADGAGGLPYLNSLAQSVLSAANIRRYAEIVAEHAATRAQLAATDEVATLCFDRSVTLAEKLDRAGALLSGLSRSQGRKTPRLLGDVVARAADRYTDLSQGRVPSGIPTGIAQLDGLLNGGLKGGKLIGVAARPSVGKSSVARLFARSAAKHGYRTLLLSQEMPEDELADCFIAQEGHIDGSRLQTGELDDMDWGRLATAMDDLRGVPIHIDDESGLTVPDVDAKVRMVKGVNLVVLDYLQLMGTTLKNKNATRAEQVAEMSGGLKRLALRLGIPIVVLSQLNRGVEMRQDREPQLSDLRESGAIEQDLDVGILLWTVKQDEESRLVGWKVAKNRGGRLGKFAQRFKPSIYAWFDSAESLHAPAPAKGRGFDE